MQNWDTLQQTANYDHHNSWYSNMFATNIKTEPGTNSSSNLLEQSSIQSPPAITTTPPSTASQLEQYLKQHHHQQHQHQQQLHHQTQMDSIAAAAVAAAAMTPSPSQNDSLQHFFDTNMQQQLLQQQQYQQQFQQAQQAAAQNQVTSTHLSLGFNPLTPPGLPNAVLPSINHFYQNSSSSVRSSNPQTPSPQPNSILNAVHNLITPNDSVNEKLQAALTPRNTPPMDVTPPKSPSPKSNLMKTSSSSEMNTFNGLEKDQDQMSNSSEDMKYESEDDESIRVPIYNSHGKMKNYKCKNCGLVAITKVSFWEHAKSHMKPEKILQCPKCPFVTELKHHLEYHIRKHKNLKPFQCDKCSYSCVNKSMLNSHRKSHSSVYQYRCADCDYATKYCHSFKLHLRKYDHKPGMVLDEEGIPNPSIVIDVYGTRRGPKSKGGNGSTNNGNNPSNSKKNPKDDNNSNDMKYPTFNNASNTSQLSAALQGFPLNPFHQQISSSNGGNPTSMPVSPAKSTSSAASDLHAMTLNMNLQQQQQHNHLQQNKINIPNPLNNQNTSSSNSIALTANSTPSSLSNILPPLSAILQQNPNMAPFFPYWNLNLQMLAAQQQAAVLAQLSPRMRETALQNLQKQNERQTSSCSPSNQTEDSSDDEDDDIQQEQQSHHDQDDEMDDQKSVDSAMDLSQGTPTKDCDEDEPQQYHQQHQLQHQQQLSQHLANQQQQEAYSNLMAMNLKMKDDSNIDTPLLSSSNSSRRKGRVLKLESLSKSASQSPDFNQKLNLNNKGSLLSPCSPPAPTLQNTLNSSKQINNNLLPPAASSPIAASTSITNLKIEDLGSSSSADESMEHVSSGNVTSNGGSLGDGSGGGGVTNSANISASSTASSSGNSSNSSNASSSSANGNAATNSSNSTSSTVSIINNASSSASSTTSGNSSSAGSPPVAAGAIYECKYCDIYFKDAVLYTIHMGYHSCDDVFKCNMCGEKCDGPVGLFVHMARNAHS